MALRYAFPATIERDGSGWMVTFDGLPGGTCGDTREEALARAQDLLVTVLAGFVEEGVPIPHPGNERGPIMINVPALTTAKLALHDAMLEQKVSNVALGRRLGLDEKTIRRLRDPLHRSRIDRVEAALHCLGKRLDVEARDDLSARAA
jgi:antitoxin HicB